MEKTKDKKSKSYRGASLLHWLFPIKTKDVNYHIIDISPKTVFMLLAIAASLFLVYQLQQVLIAIILGFIISSILSPFVRNLEKRDFKKGFSVGLVYVISLVVSIAIGLLIFVPFVIQLQKLGKSLPLYNERIVENINNTFNTEFTVEGLSEIMLTSQIDLSSLNFESFGSAIDFLASFGDVAAILFLSLIISIYIISDKDELVKSVVERLFSREKRKVAYKFVNEIEIRLGWWLSRQSIVCSIVAVIVFLMLTVARVPFSIPLAIFAGLLVVVPLVGPAIAFVPIFLVTLFSHGIWVALAVLVGYLIVQQFENSYLTPKMMGTVVGVRPLFIFLGILVGTALGGFAGAFMTVPTLVIIKIAYDVLQDDPELLSE